MTYVISWFDVLCLLGSLASFTFLSLYLSYSFCISVHLNPDNRILVSPRLVGMKLCSLVSNSKRKARMFAFWLLCKLHFFTNLVILDSFGHLGS